MTQRHRVTERDIAILESVEAARYLTVEHLQWLHWPVWRERLRAAQAGGRDPDYGPRKSYTRVRFLAQAGYLTPIVRLGNRGKTTFERLGNVYCITRAGCAAIAERRGRSLEELWWEERSERALLTLEHRVALGAFYAALRSELAYRGRALEGWLGDHRLAQDYDTVAVPQARQPLPILPDATFRLDGRRYFVEIDRATVRLSQWEHKAQALQAYQGSPALARRYGVDRALLLIVAPSAQRVQAIARTIAGVARGAAPAYRFLTDDRVHPTSIRRRWQALGAVSFTPVRRGDTATLAPSVTLDDAPPLWTPDGQ